MPILEKNIKNCMLVDCCANIDNPSCPPSEEDAIFPQRGALQFVPASEVEGQNGKGEVEVRLHVPCAIVATAPALGFPDSSLEASDLDALDDATRAESRPPSMPMSERLKQRYLHHPDHADLHFLYSVFVTESGRGAAASGGRAGVGVCFFADQQVDRSPTGSGVQARVALAVPKGERSMGQGWTYHSLLSRASEGAKEKDDDLVGEGFDFEALGARSRLEN
ncbi:hypothetical protein IWZ03DRAFT_415999 [Phyllosticta citriasiana]|uniref:trans-L-3-hydroxyproline dehydratase n=1 Tax=Phyllosticta citriasiana TaxID=595635 RepID=A0ABR1KGP2_9PEZI